MRARVVCDTNILISALVFPGGSPDKIVRLARIGEVDLYVSPFVIDEFERVLREKFKYSKRQIEERSKRITAISTVVSPSEKVQVIQEDISDNRILECAIAAKAQVIVSGDKHLLSLKEFTGIAVVSAAEFLRSI